MKDKSVIYKINPTFIALTVTAIHQCQAVWNTGEFRVPPVFGPGGGAQRECNTSNINHVVNKACTAVFHRHNADFCSSSPEVQAKLIDNICSMIHRSIHSTGMDPAMAQHHNDQGSFDKDFLLYVPEKLIEQPESIFIWLSSFVAATEASMQFSAVLPIGGSAITISSKPVPCNNSNSKTNDMTSMTNITSVENMGLVDGSTIVVGAMSLGD